MRDTIQKTATLYSMFMPEHRCPYGLRAKDLLQRHGYEVKDKHLTTREEVERFKQAHHVTTTPQIFIDDNRIGGFDDLRRHLGIRVRDKNATTYQPVIALFCVAALLALSLSWIAHESFFNPQAIEWFIAISMVLLGLQKLKDIEGFATSFLNYDLLAQKWVRYGYIYPFVETGAGLFMIAGVLVWLCAPAALIVASIGAISVFKAVYIDKRDLRCACVGGNSNVPLGFISLLENLMMIGMAVWMMAKAVF